MSDVPQGLFTRIIKRLGIEKQLQVVRRHLGLFAVLLFVCLVLAFIAFLKLHDALMETSFGPYVAIAIHDPRLLFAYAHSFLFLLIESVPGIGISITLFLVACVMLIARYAGSAIDTWKHLTSQK